MTSISISGEVSAREQLRSLVPFGPFDIHSIVIENRSNSNATICSKS